MKKNNKRKNQKGFTLIELIVVVAILGILAALAIPRLTKATDSAKIGAHNANVSAVKSAAALYVANNPDATGDITDGVKEYMEGGVMPTAPVVRNITENTTYTVVLSEEGDIIVYPSNIEGDGDATLKP